MTRARGQPSRTSVNSEYPHQVLVVAQDVGGKTFDRVLAFHKERGITVVSRSAYRGDEWFTIFCFTLKENAEKFRTKFDGELLQRPERHS